MWDIAFFVNGTIGGSGYDFNISFFDKYEETIVDDPCTSSFGHHLVCVNQLREKKIWENNYVSKIYNGIIVTDIWILSSATACLNIFKSPWNDYVIRAGTHNLTKSGDSSVIKKSLIAFL